MPAAVTVGYSVVIYSIVIPAARQSRIALTGTRVSAITAWPCTTRGSVEIISSCSLVTVLLCRADGKNAKPASVRGGCRAFPLYLEEPASVRHIVGRAKPLILNGCA
jgi:hypothetical protein